MNNTHKMRIPSTGVTAVLSDDGELVYCGDQILPTSIWHLQSRLTGKDIILDNADMPLSTNCPVRMEADEIHSCRVSYAGSEPKDELLVVVNSLHDTDDELDGISPEPALELIIPESCMHHLRRAVTRSGGATPHNTNSRETRVTVVEDCVIITTKPNHTYDIELSRIPDEAAVVEWVHHICSKGWADPQLIKEFIDVTFGAKGWKVYRNV